MNRVWTSLEWFKIKIGFNPARLHCLFAITILFCLGFLIVCPNNNMQEKLLYKSLDMPLLNKGIYENFDEIFTISTDGCRIPALTPLTKSIERFVQYPKSLKACRSLSFDPLENNKTHIWIKKKIKQIYRQYNSLICCYKSFYRPASINDISSLKIDNRVQYNKCILFTNEIKVSDDFVKIECMMNEKVIYKQYFLFTSKKKLSDPIKKIYKSKTAYNILMLGIDGVSRLNFHRTMPKTLQFLKNKGVVEFLGYNKVGDNTFPNIVPMLVGVKENELKSTCLPHSWSTFDNCPFIWEWFKQFGYYTAFGEDTSSLGTFNYQRSGFLRNPTDYYIHTFIHEAERNAGNNKDFNSFLCMNEKYFYQILLSYIEDLTVTLKYTKLFGFFWEVTMSHDRLNYPMIMDNSYEKFLGRLDASKYLDETILFLLSDHGIRWGEMRSTKQGRLEERLPFVYILVPDSFRYNYGKAYNNLKLNSKRLTTPFDLYATLNDLVDLDNINDEQIHRRSQKEYSQNRSISLFLPIPKNRTCQLANIDDHWCTCLRTKKVSLSDPTAEAASSHLLKYLNELVHSYNKCAHLTLAELLDISEVDFRDEDKEETGWREFMIVIRTTPGDGVFEATLRHDNQNWLLSGTVSRLNLYGNQSSCMDNYHLKLYCFCI